MLSINCCSIRKKCYDAGRYFAEAGNFFLQPIYFLLKLAVFNPRSIANVRVVLMSTMIFVFGDPSPILSALVVALGIPRPLGAYKCRS